MSRAASPETIARTRSVPVDAILDGGVDLGGYPHRHLFLYSVRGMTVEARMTRLLTCVDLLDGQGWELVNVLPAHRRYLHAVLRRR